MVRECRPLLKLKHTYFAIAFCVILLLPFLIALHKSDWIIIKTLSGFHVTANSTNVIEWASVWDFINILLADINLFF